MKRRLTLLVFSGNNVGAASTGTQITPCLSEAETNRFFKEKYTLRR
jgi:hypothetical protein